MAPQRAIRAVFDADTIVVYQAYRREIALAALAAQRFVPPFSLGRMTWIKPSFLWMMERCGWASKPGQEHVLAVHLRRDAFEAALRLAVLTHPEGGDGERWREELETSPVRVQWDPERSLRGGKLEHRSLQVGLGRGVIESYASEWIVRLEEVTELAHRIQRLREAGEWERARALLPNEREYPTPEEIKRRLGMDG